MGASGFIMSAPREGRYGSIARKWLALVERRQQHFIELCNTGRWRHYYSEGEFRDEMHQLLRLRNQWAEIAGLPLADVGAEEVGLPPRRPRTPVGSPAMLRQGYAAE